MSQIPVYVLPLLVEQPTWGGKYIAGFKNLTHELLAGKKIGQSFELATDSWVTSQPITAQPFLFATATDLAHPTFIAKPSDAQPLQKVIDQNPKDFLGERVVAEHGPSMDVLIKFTQAQNNSYQVHVQPGQEFGKWQAKPESWYYLEPGTATLGLNPETSITKYQQRCQEIDDFAQSLSAQIKAGQLDVAAARTQLKAFINQDHPRRFVNTISVPAQKVIDLSAGGIHHSWEVDPDLPNGNIVYEVQKNVMDEFCTLRSFDQGSIKDDGKVRPLTIDEYFKALDTDPTHNDPAQYLQDVSSESDETALITKLFDNQFYKTTAIEWSGKYQGVATQTAGSFHHLFAQSGKVSVLVRDQKWSLPVGWSLLIPAEIREYAVESSIQAKILITSH